MIARNSGKANDSSGNNRHEKKILPVIKIAVELLRWNPFKEDQ